MTEDVLLASDRADDLDRESLLRLFVGEGGDEEIVLKLMSPGAHLVEGSRGTGKTMLLKVAHERIRLNRPSILPVFVRFAKYLATYNPRSRSVVDYSPFQSWVLAKILSAMRDALLEMRPALSPRPDLFGPMPLDSYVSRLETHYEDDRVADPAVNAEALRVHRDDVISFARLDLLGARICEILDASGYRAVWFLFDEAAQNFAEELQPEFFQIVKHLRHERIAVKAAVYPNVTVYGRDFDVGHDAEVVQIERRVEQPEGMMFFHQLVTKRFGQSHLGRALSSAPSQRDFLIKASGGNPRWFLHLVSSAHTRDAGLSASSALGAVKDLADSTLWAYLSGLKYRLMFRRKYVDTAINLARVLVEDLREFNRQMTWDDKRLDGSRPVCYVAVSTHKTLPYRVHASVNLLVYSGLLSKRGPVRITAREGAHLYLVHPALLVTENALFGPANPPLEALVRALSEPSRETFKEYTRNSPRLLGYESVDAEGGSLCDYCGASLQDGAKFCSQCGRPVTEVSPYKELLAQPSGYLELTPGVKQRLLDDGRFPTVGDILKATNEELDQIPYVGQARVKLIRYAAEEFVAG